MEHLQIMNIDATYISLSFLLRLILWACLFLAVGLDLYHGIRKSKDKGEYTHSKGLRATIDKCSKYLTFMFFMLIGDMFWHISSAPFLPVGVSVLPIFTIVGTLILVRIEYISVKETMDQKMLTKINRSTDELINLVGKVVEVYHNNPTALEKALQLNKDREKERKDNHDKTD